MTTSMREHLLGFLLGALDPSEQTAVEQALEKDPQLQRELQTLQRRLEPLRTADETRQWDPPAGLADRACSMIFREVDEFGNDALVDRQESIAPESMVPEPIVPESIAPEPMARGGRARQAATPARLPTHESSEPLGRGGNWWLSDVAVAAGVFLAASLLFFPAIANSRYNARIAACQNNLRQLGVQLVLYSQGSGQGYYPYVPIEGERSFAGNYAVTLQEYGLLPTPELLLCADSEWGQRRNEFRVPTNQQLVQANPEALRELRRMAGGSYGSGLGHVVDQRHRPARRVGRSHFALMCDVPGTSPGRVSPNHGQLGQNVLFEDGRVRYVVGCLSEKCKQDDPLVNLQGRVEAGWGFNDSVLAPSETPPFQRSVVYPR